MANGREMSKEAPLGKELTSIRPEENSINLAKRDAKEVNSCLNSDEGRVARRTKCQRDGSH